jgi:Acetyltransferase (GNAT) domain
MQVSVRDSTTDDVATMMLICCNPLVQANQFKVGLGTEAGFRQILDKTLPSGRIENRLASIEVDGAMVGYIIHSHYRYGQLNVARLGWNLHPNYWGRGIMPQGLAQLFERCVRVDETHFFSADCFRQNTRCKRVLSKLGFKPVPIPLFDRVCIALGQSCLKWIERFELEASKFKSDSGVDQRKPQRTSSKPNLPP